MSGAFDALSPSSRASMESSSTSDPLRDVADTAVTADSASDAEGSSSSLIRNRLSQPGVAFIPSAVVGSGAWEIFSTLLPPGFESLRMCVYHDDPCWDLGMEGKTNNVYRVHCTCISGI